MAAQKEFPSDRADKFVVRFPDGLRERIKRVADENGRSMNAQIVFMLQAFLDGRDREEALRELSRFEPPAEQQIGAPAAAIAARYGISGEEAPGLNTEQAVDRLADKVVERLMSVEGFVAKIQRQLQGLDEEGNPINYNPPRTPTIPGANAPKGGSKAPKKKGV